MRFQIGIIVLLTTGPSLWAGAITWQTDAFFTKCPTANGAAALQTNFVCKSIADNRAVVVIATQESCEQSHERIRTAAGCG